ncbi:MAG: single-stranded-DNA-specific exonuclease RecJ [Candidatus Omnitrophica bacterium]|nr:single-stranded-DNA-specific exonuclease RecJ [Candidatus Omnitrophota bacterium]
MITEWALKTGPGPDARPGPNVELAQELNITPLTVQLLRHRKINSAHEARNFLFGSLDDLQDPYLIKGMEKAVRRILHAIDTSELVIVHGDYDVDGVTASAIVGRVLTRLGARWKPFVPHRVKNGYGFTKDGVAFAKEQNANVIITLDCGTGSIEEVAAAQELGIDCLVFDHHQIKDGNLPEAYSLINPFQLDCQSPFKLYCATGLALKLAQALLGKKALEYLDLSALGTVGDMVPLVGENRLFVKYGLRAMSENPRVAIRAMAESAKLKSRKIHVGHLGFVFAPRINASGRLDSAEVSLNLLLSEDVVEAAKLAQELEKQNKKRRDLEQDATKQAIKKVEMEVNFNQDRVIVVWDEAWHPGVIGIVAARLVERFHRPSLVISLNEGMGKGSGRSVRKVNLYELLKRASAPLVQFGGHEQAVGLSVEEKSLPAFRKLINEIAREWVLPEYLSKTFEIDAEIGLQDLTLRQMKEISMLEPFGLKNPKPVFLTRNVELKPVPSRWFAANERRFFAIQGGQNFEAVWNPPGDAASTPLGHYDIIYSPALKVWEGHELFELEIRDIKKRG